VRDGRTVGSRRRALGIDVDPLVATGSVSERVNPVLELVVMAELGVSIESGKAMPLSTGPEVSLGRWQSRRQPGKGGTVHYSIILTRMSNWTCIGHFI